MFAFITKTMQTDACKKRSMTGRMLPIACKSNNNILIFVIIQTKCRVLWKIKYNLSILRAFCTLLITQKFLPTKTLQTLTIRQNPLTRKTAVFRKKNFSCTPIRIFCNFRKQLTTSVLQNPLILRFSKDYPLPSAR